MDKSVSPPSSRAKGVALKNVTVMNISVVPTSYPLCWLFVTMHWILQMSTHVCMYMNACSLFGCDYGQVANSGVCHPQDDAYFSIRVSWDGNEGAFHSLACSCCMDDPNQGLWLGCFQSGRLHVMWPTWWWTNVGYMRYRLAVVSVYDLVERLMMIVSVTGGQWVHTSPRWHSWYSFTLC